MKIRHLFKQKDQTSKGKDWRHAFYEHDAEKYPASALVNHALANAVLIKKCRTCDKYTMLLAYVAQFEHGGFWLEKGKLHFVTAGTNSDNDATYEDAKQFIEQWEKLNA